MASFAVSLLLATAVVFAASSASVAATLPDVILKPTNSGRQQAAIIWAQGAEINATAYVPLMQDIQNLFPDLALWVGIPSYPLNVAEPLVLAAGIERVIKTMESQGMNTTRFVYGGHSLGGAMIQDYVAQNKPALLGQILMGAFITRGNRNMTGGYPVATLSIGGEMDGLCRCTRMAEGYYHQVLHASASEALRLPVVILPGVSHMQFASGTPPPLVKAQDLKPEISIEQARAEISTLSHAFISLLMGDQSGLSYLQSQLKATGEFVAPIITAMELEGNIHLKPPCYKPSTGCIDGCPYNPGPDCIAYNPWVLTAQVIMANVSRHVNVTSEMHPVYQINPVHLPAIHHNCTSTDPSCVIEVSTVSDVVMEELDGLDTGDTFITAHEIRAKLKSRQSMMAASAIDKPQPEFNVTDAKDLNICASINQAAYNWAVAHVAPKTAARYQSLGVKMEMTDDLGPYDAGPLWIWTYLTWGNGSEPLTVGAPFMSTPDKFWISFSEGFHYCKLLSPARVVEWIYVDSLRAHDGIHSE